MDKIRVVLYDSCIFLADIWSAARHGKRNQTYSLHSEKKYFIFLLSAPDDSLP